MTALEHGDRSAADTNDRSGGRAPLLQQNFASPSSQSPSRALLDVSRTSTPQQKGSPTSQASPMPRLEAAPGGTGDSVPIGDIATGSAQASATAKCGQAFLTGTAAPAFQFAFLFRTELEQLRADLMDGSVTGPEAAARLMECERRVFSEPMLTQPRDCFLDEGITPQEEWMLLHGGNFTAPAAAPDESEAKGEANPEEEEEEDESSEDEDEEEESEAEGDGRPDWAKGRPWPTREEAVLALKVLGVLPEVPVGPKAPCSDDDLPVCLDRLEAVLRQLAVSETKVNALVAMLQNDAALRTSQTESSFFCGGQREASVAQPLRQPTILPLRQVLQALYPVPLRKSGTCGPLARCFRRIRRCSRCCGRSCRKRKARRTTPANGGAEEAGEGEGDSNMEEPPPPSPVEEQLRRRRATESIFAAHKLDCCTLCSGYFRPCHKQH